MATKMTTTTARGDKADGVLTESRGRLLDGCSTAVGISLLLFIALTLPVTLGTVLCNEYDTCFLTSDQANVTEALKDGEKGKVCSLAKTALACLGEARRDCDGYKNLPDNIVQGLQDKRNNLTSYTDSYCGTNGVAGRTTSMAAVLTSTVLILFWIWS